MDRSGRPSLGYALTSLLPTAVFLLNDNLFGLVPAMIAASITTLGLLILRRSGGKRVGILLPVSLAYVVVKAIAGIITESPVVYFGAGLVLTALLAVGIGATAFTRTPVASYALPLVTPYRHLNSDHPIYRRVAAQVTAAWAIAELGITGWEGWHLTVVSASEFVATRALVTFWAMGILIFFLIGYVRFRLDRYENHLAANARTTGDAFRNAPAAPATTN